MPRLNIVCFTRPMLEVNILYLKLPNFLSSRRSIIYRCFDDHNDFEGIISARRILAQFKDSPIFHVKISEFLRTKNKPLVTVSQDELVSAALHLFKTTKLSKLIVISQDMKLKGILSYYDLISYLVSPKNVEHRGER